MEENYIHYKQKELFDVEQPQTNIYVYGAGSIGSHTVMGLAKTGFKNITVYDYDIVEEDNIPAQFFSYSNINESKTKSIHDLVKMFTNIKIQHENIKIDETFQPNLENNSIHILAVDDIDIRKLLMEKLEGFPVTVIDGRIGNFFYEIYNFDCSNDITCEQYKESLNQSFSELSCGEKCLWNVNSIISSKIISQCININKNKVHDNLFCVKGHALGNKVIEIKERELDDMQ